MSETAEKRSTRSAVTAIPRQRPPGIASWNVVNKLQKRSLLIAINCIAGLSIFFFGYDQGMMGGVNNANDYINRMGFGYVDPQTNEPVITDSLLQGGIVSVYYLGTLFGALFGGWTGEKVGRIKTIAIGAAWGVFGAALQTSAMNHTWMIFGMSTVHVIEEEDGRPDLQLVSSMGSARVS